MISVFGSGAFGTALAISLAQIAPVRFWSRNEDAARAMTRSRVNADRLPGADLPLNIDVTGTIPKMSPKDIGLIAIPTQSLRQFLDAHKNHISEGYLVACCKGVERGTSLGPTQIITQCAPKATAAMLTGPSFARDIARGMPTALTLACADHEAGAYLQHTLTTPNLRLYRTTDTIGAELGGALKNVVAIACGAVMGAGLGESTRAALMTRGFAEMSRMAIALGADADTLAGLSGFGDLTLTCTSDQSRNYRFGLSLGKGEDFDPAITVEGAATAKAVQDYANAHGIDMPITSAVVGLIDGKLRVEDAIDMLLSRPLKEE